MLNPIKRFKGSILHLHRIGITEFDKKTMTLHFSFRQTYHIIIGHSIAKPYLH